MKRIIAIYGTSNVGKSETIKLVYTKLLKMFPSITFFKNFIQITPQKGDICVVFTINGKIIGIESQGDPNSRIFKSLQIFINLNCNVIICATRTRGATVKEVEKHKINYEIKWIRKKGEANSLKQKNQDYNLSDTIVNEILELKKDEQFYNND